MTLISCQLFDRKLWADVGHKGERARVPVIEYFFDMPKISGSTSWQKAVRKGFCPEQLLPVKIDNTNLHGPRV